jgi:hypothetical protein
MDYDPQLGGSVLFGGLSANGETFLNDTWLFTAPWSPTYRVQLEASPARCGPLTWDAFPESNGTIVTDPAGVYDVTAAQCHGFAFENWLVVGNASVTNVTSASTTVALTGNASIEAVYAPAFPVAFKAGTSSCGYLLVAGNPVQLGGNLTLTNGTYALVAPVCSGIAFASWTSSGEASVESARNASTSLMVQGAGIVTVNYGTTGSSPVSNWSFVWLGVGLAVGLLAGIIIGATILRRRPPKLAASNADKAASKDPPSLASERVRH